MSEYKEVYGTQTDRPKEVEVNVDTVYLRKNIERISQTNENGEIESLWKYLARPWDFYTRDTQAWWTALSPCATG